MKYFNSGEFAVIPGNDYRARAAYHYIATGQRLNASHYRELSQVEIPDDIDQCIDDHRAEVHQDPAVLEEQEPEDNDQDNEDEDDDDENVPEMSDREADGEEDLEDNEEEIWAQFKSAQLALENKLKKAIHDKNFRKCLKTYTSRVQKVANSQEENLKQHLYAFGQSLGKLKKGSRIPIQPASEQRRKNPQGGRAVGLQGRRVQDGPKRMRLDVTATEDLIVHTLPIQKPQAPKQPHNLAIAEARNVANAKKH